MLPRTNLAWNTNTLATDGTLSIVSVAVTGGDLAVTGTNGVPDWPYYLLSSTNVTAPLFSWTRIATNQCDASGAFAVTNAINPAVARQFYLLQLQ